MDWSKLDDLQPYSVDNSPSEEIQSRAVEYDMAIELGIVRNHPESYEEYPVDLYL